MIVVQHVLRGRRHYCLEKLVAKYHADSRGDAEEEEVESFLFE
jgi:hypothetical protein